MRALRHAALMLGFCWSASVRARSFSAVLIVSTDAPENENGPAASETRNEAIQPGMRFSARTALRPNPHRYCSTDLRGVDDEDALALPVESGAAIRADNDDAPVRGVRAERHAIGGAADRPLLAHAVLGQDRRLAVRARHRLRAHRRARYSRS